ncbi:hypothetical protein AHF37_10747 [Paragonimus kellicotti]|nr:hypothetical protein AHF37_10747 [Paragonimus kellicotti]
MPLLWCICSALFLLIEHRIELIPGLSFLIPSNTPSFTFMFMELLPGGELFERIPIGIGLHVQQMFIYYSQILDALHYLHTDQHIAHLDVKPENIMLTKKDKAKLIDFGWAVDLRKSNLLRGPVGTTSYAAPEVCPHFKRHFVYLLPKVLHRSPGGFILSGCHLLTAVTGQRCWSRANPDVDPVYKQWTDRRDLHTGPIFSRLPPDLANFLTRALAHRPTERLTVEGIRGHPWFRRGLLRRLTPVSPPPHFTSGGPRSDENSMNSTTSSFAFVGGFQSDAPGMINLFSLHLVVRSERINVR